MSEIVEEDKHYLDQILEDDSHPSNPDDWMSFTQKVRFGLIKDNIHMASDPKVMARIESLASGIDKQVLTKLRMAQDKEEGEANRDVANDIFARMVASGMAPSGEKIDSPMIESSGLDHLDGELIQGDDTTNSIIED